MIQYPNIDPVAISLGPMEVHWYGLMYLLAFSMGWWLARVRAAKPQYGWSLKEVDDLVFYTVLGVILGGRVGYILFYQFSAFIDDPTMIFRVWQGGMSFHGGMLGVFVAMWLLGRRSGRTFYQVTDFMAPFVPLGLGAGRIGNFINIELWGKTTEVPWGIVFPYAGPLPRHPTQLYEGLLEGLLLFLVIWWFSSSMRPRMAVSGVFLLGYGAARCLVEFWRLPDEHLGYLAFDWVTMGHVLSFPMIVWGLICLYLAYTRKEEVA